jgi:hypothetical protein
MPGKVLSLSICWTRKVETQPKNAPATCDAIIRRAIHQFCLNLLKFPWCQDSDIKTPRVTAGLKCPPETPPNIHIFPNKASPTAKCYKVGLDAEQLSANAKLEVPSISNMQTQTLLYFIYLKFLSTTSIFRVIYIIIIF